MDTIKLDNVMDNCCSHIPTRDAGTSPDSGPQANLREPFVCRICGANRHSSLIEGLADETNQMYSLLKCHHCLLVTTSPLPKKMEALYAKEYWSAASRETLVDKFYELRMQGITYGLRRFVKRNARILDWGAGNGNLARLIRKYGYDCWGIEPYHRSTEDDRIISAPLAEAPFKKDSFDAITCIHVLEHLEDPVGNLRAASRLLKPGGFLLIEVPNISSIGFRLFKSRWQPLEIPSHLNHFDSASLKNMLSRCHGFRILKRSFFSAHASPAAWVLSCVPSLSPRNVRKRYRGRHPWILKALYLCLQMLAYPFAVMESCLNRGSIMRVWIQKEGVDR